MRKTYSEVLALKENLARREAFLQRLKETDAPEQTIRYIEEDVMRLRAKIAEGEQVFEGLFT